MAERVPTNSVHFQCFPSGFPNVSLLDLVCPPWPASIWVRKNPVFWPGAGWVRLLVPEKDLGKGRIERHLLLGVDGLHLVGLPEYIGTLYSEQQTVPIDIPPL